MRLDSGGSLPLPDELLHPAGVSKAWARASRLRVPADAPFVIGICDSAGAIVAVGELPTMRQVNRFTRFMNTAGYVAQAHTIAYERCHLVYVQQ